METNEGNRLHEDCELFYEIVNSKWMSDYYFILFLNKYDMFKEKIKEVPLSAVFEDCQVYINPLLKLNNITGKNRRRVVKVDNFEISPQSTSSMFFKQY